jgi:hypothetical protein
VNPLHDLRLSRKAIAALAVGLSGFGPVALAQAPQADLEKMRALTTEIYREANASYGFKSGKGLRTEETVNCEDARKRAHNLEPGRTKAAERYEAAIIFRQCIENRKAELYATYAPELARLGGGIHPALATDLIQQAMKAQIESADMSVRSNKAQAAFMDMTFGVGVGVSFSKDGITAAEVAANGTVRVTERQKQVPRAILEAHYYGVCEKRLKACDDGSFGVGPFFGLAATNDTIESFALGVMFGWKDTSHDSGGGFSIGIGAVLDKEVKQLAPGFQEGAPLPPGETEPKFEMKSKWSPLLFFTKTF